MAREIGFIDSGIPDLDVFLSGLRPGLEAILLSPKRAAPAQIADALRGRADLEAIHIVAHGAPGTIGFASGALTIETLKEHAADLAEIGDALAPHGEVLLWSCETGKGERGANFVAALEHVSGTSVSASTGLIGAMETGGCWTLERGTVGRAPLTAEASGTYRGLLTLGIDLDTNVSGIHGSSSYAEHGDTISLFESGNLVPDFLNWIYEIDVFIGSWNGTETLSVSGAVPANVQVQFSNGSLTISTSDALDKQVFIDLLRSIQYNDQSNDNPSATRTLGVTVWEATIGGVSSASATETINITRSNDPPVATITKATYSATEQTALNLKGTDLSIGDVDANSGGMLVNLSVTQGTLSAAAGDSGAGVSGSGTDTLTITGTVAQINAFLSAGGTSSLSYVNNSNTPAASVTLSMTVHDNGATGDGDLTGSDNATINITAVNDAPLAANDATAVNEYATVTGNVITNLAGKDTDPESQSLTVTAIAGGTVGSALTGAKGTLTLNADGSYSYVANHAEPLVVGTTVQDVFTYTVSDGTATDTATLTVTITGVATGNAASNYLLGNASANALSGLGGNDILNGLGGNDTLVGADGNDALIGGVGIDILNGGVGVDTMNGGGDNDIFLIAGVQGLGDVFNGATGVDKIQVLGTASASLAGFNPASSIEVWQGNNKGVVGTAANNVLNFSSLTSKTGLPFVDGGAGNDSLTGSKFADDLRGNLGNDALTGGLGRDLHTGGAGADRFDFNALNESVKGANRDVITDLNHSQHDRIDLSTIDADTDGTAGNQAFKFIGAVAFHGIDGELRCAAGIVQGDVNGDKVADFEIKVNLATLLGSDFIL